MGALPTSRPAVWEPQRPTGLAEGSGWAARCGGVCRDQVRDRDLNSGLGGAWAGGGVVVPPREGVVGWGATPRTPLLTPVLGLWTPEVLAGQHLVEAAADRLRTDLAGLLPTPQSFSASALQGFCPPLRQKCRDYRKPEDPEGPHAQQRPEQITPFCPVPLSGGHMGDAQGVPGSLAQRRGSRQVTGAGLRLGGGCAAAVASQ